jgi:hypothetical protein
VHSVLFAVDAAVVGVFAVDMLARFRVGYYEGDELVLDGRRVAQHNLRTTFALDLVRQGGLGGGGGGEGPGALRGAHGT